MNLEKVVNLMRVCLETSGEFDGYETRPAVYTSPRENPAQTYTLQLAPTGTREENDADGWVVVTDTIRVIGTAQLTQETAVVGTDKRPGVVRLANDVKRALDALDNAQRTFQSIRFTNTDYDYGVYPVMVFDLSVELTYRQMTGER